MNVGNNKANHQFPLLTTAIHMHPTLTRMPVAAVMTITTVRQTDILLLRLEAGWIVQSVTTRRLVTWIGLGPLIRGTSPILQNMIVGKVASEMYPEMIILGLTGAGRATRAKRALALEIAVGQLVTRNGAMSQFRGVRSGLETHDHLGHQELPLPIH